jgi:hypothetical protein
MTADDGTGAAPDALTIPTWPPKPVANAARALHVHYLKSNNIKYNAILERLIADERMRLIWGELSRRRRNKQYQKTDAFLHPTYLSWIESEAPQDHQDEAMASLLHLAVNLAGDAARVITRKELETVRRDVSGKVVALRIAADELRRYGSGKAAVKATEDIARNLEEQLSRMETSPLVVDRVTGDAQARRFCIFLTRYCRQLFGLPLYGVTAKVASVALGRDITVSAVREMVRLRPCG